LGPVSQSLHAPAASSGRLPLVSALRSAYERMQARRALSAARRAADREILLDAVPSLRHSWRAAELVVPKNRLELARTLRNVVRESASRHAISASPVNRRAVRAESTRLLQLGDRLANLERPVAARGVLLVQHLLSGGLSPLYDAEHPEALRFHVEAALEALEPR
jgi:hypothetical protein